MSTTNHELARQRAERHALAGNWDAARAEWLGILAVAPDPADAMLSLSYVESMAGRYRAAHEWTMRAVRAAPRSVDGLLSLMRRLRTFNEAATLRGIVDALLGHPRLPPPVLVESARQLSNLNDHELAMRCAQAAVAAAPDAPPARLVHGLMLAHFARIEEAQAEFEWILARNASVAPAWWALSRLRKQTPGSNHVQQLRALLAKPGLTGPDKAAAARALHKELDDLGDVEGAWQALEVLCRTMRASVRYDAGESRALIEALMAFPPGPVLETPISAKVPIFIVGMHRSGTTLLEQLLDASPQVRGVGELNDFTSAMRYATDHQCLDVVDMTLVERARAIDFAEVGRRYLGGLAWRFGEERFFTDKLPSNFLNIGFICRALPHARILHMVRDPVETCFSNLRELFSDTTNLYSYDQVELGRYHLEYRRLMAHWHAVFPGRILDVDYARLTADPGVVMREVAAFCGIDYVDGMRSTSSSNRAVSTASSIQVRGEVTRRETPKWAPYGSHLQPLIRVLREGGLDVPAAGI